MHNNCFENRFTSFETDFEYNRMKVLMKVFFVLLLLLFFLSLNLNLTKKREEAPLPYQMRYLSTEGNIQSGGIPISYFV